MAEIKTKPTDADVDAYLASRASPEQLADCQIVMGIFRRVTNATPKMWGASIVGFGSYTYRYKSGHTGDWCMTGFAVRGKELVVYLMVSHEGQAELLAKLGKHRMTKSCLYIKRLTDVNVEVLEALITASVAEVRRLYPDVGSDPA